jgi:hypothetical protein
LAKEPPPMASQWVVQPAPTCKMEVAETTPKNLGGGSVNLVWPKGGFSHLKLVNLGVVQPPPKGQGKNKIKFGRVGP